MRYLIAKPSAFLAPYIKQYWMIDNTLSEGVNHIQSIVPSGLMELTFHFADLPEPISGSGHLRDQITISGQSNRHFDLTVSGHLNMFSITFQAQGAGRFFSIPLNELCNQTIPLRFIQDQSISKIHAELTNTKSFKEKIELIESFLLQRFMNNFNSLACARIDDSLKAINQNPGLLNVDELASRACLSRKQYERNFSECIGISPKQFLRVIRFQQAIYKKQQNPDLSLTALAADCDYYDQSHMIAEFRQLTGRTPTQFFNECDPYSDYFS